jgi:hypothetical protein
MQLDETTVPLQPRRAFGCIDVAVRFYGAHLGRLLEIWSLVALPCCVLTYILSLRSEMDVRLTLLVLYVGTWIAGVLTVSGAGRALFGEPFVPGTGRGKSMDFARALQMTSDVAALLVGAVIFGDVAADVLGTDFIYGRVEDTWYAALFAVLIVRLVVAMIVRARVTRGFWKALSKGVFPVLLGILLSLFLVVVALRTGFVAESKLLASLDEQLRGQGLRDLMKKETGDLFSRSLAIVGFGWLMAIVVFFTIDWACNLLLGYPILLGRIWSSGGGANGVFVQIEQTFRMMTGDPRCLAVFAAAVMLVYPIVRLAWFFCYVDLRVRRDCWDMELLFRQEARRLEGVA